MNIQFRTIATTALSALNGFLISLPCSALVEGYFSIACMILFTLGGARIGYRKRESTLFFYLSLVSALILISVVTKNGITN